MGSILRFSLAVSALVAACSTQGSGLDSESHFACNSDADCAVHDGRPVCVEHVCEPPDGSMPVSGGSTARGGAGATHMTGGAGGTGGRGVAGSGGMSPALPDATPPREAGPDTGPPVVDAGVCNQCTSALTPEQSLDCYCRTHDCDRDLAAALADPNWQFFYEGCSLLTVEVDLGLDVQTESFDRSGRLVGAAYLPDFSGDKCVSPIDPSGGRVAGGHYISPFRPDCAWKNQCVLREVADGGGRGDRCNQDALLSEVGADAGPPCATGEILASVCTSCLAGCGRRELKCVMTCGTTADCTAAHVTGTCVDSICQEFCPF